MMMIDNNDNGNDTTLYRRWVKSLLS